MRRQSRPTLGERVLPMTDLELIVEGQRQLMSMLTGMKKRLGIKPIRISHGTQRVGF